MNFKNYSTSDNPDLTARKAWFVFDDEIVALGAGITGIDPERTTETIVENKKINGDNKLVVDGQETAPELGDQEKLTDVQWAWLAGNTDKDAVGYYFPEGSDVNVLRESRTGKWTDVNGSNGVSEEPVTRNYLSLAIPHGENVNNNDTLSSFKNEYYDYVLLPGKTQDEMAAYAENNSIRVLANTTDVQAAADTALGVYGFNFWNASGLDLPEGCMMNHVESDSPVSLTLWNENGDLHIGIADPTQEGGIVTVTLLGEGLAVGNARSAGTVTAVEGGIQIQVNMSELNGAALNIDATAPALEPNPEPQPDPGEKPGQGGSSAPSEPQGQTPADNTAAEPEQPEAAAPQLVRQCPRLRTTSPLTALVMALAASGAAAAGITLLRKKHRKE